MRIIVYIWPDIDIMQCDRFFGKLCFFSIHVSAIGLLLLVKNCAYYIRIFTVVCTSACTSQWD